MRPNRPVGSAAATLLATTWLLPLAAFALPLPASALPLRRGRRRRLRAGFASLATVAVAGEATATAAGCLTGAASSVGGLLRRRGGRARSPPEPEPERRGRRSEGRRVGKGGGRTGRT